MFTNKNVFVRSIALIVMILMISAVALTACGDKAAQDAAANAQTTANAAKDALAKLDTDVKGLVAAVDAMKADVAKINTTIETINTKIADLEAADEVNEEAIAANAEAIASLKASVATLEAAKATLETKVATLETKVATLEADVATAKTDITALKAAVEAVKADVKANADAIDALEASVGAIGEWVMDLEDWNEATLEVVDALAALADEYITFQNGGECELHDVEYEGEYFYSDTMIAGVAYQYNVAMYAIVRSTSLEDQENVIKAFCDYLNAIPNVYEELLIYIETILEDGKATYPDDRAAVLAGKALYEYIMSDVTLYNKACDEYIVPNPADPEDDDYNVLDWFYDVAIEYAKDWVTKYGVELKADMEYVLAQPITLTLYDKSYNKDVTKPNYDPTWCATDVSYDTWCDMIAMLAPEGFDYDEEVEKIEGFDEVIDAFYAQALADRFDELKAAKVEADAFNAALELKRADIFSPAKMQKNINAATRTAINNEWVAIETWCNTYHIPSSEKDAEAKDDIFVQENYDMINHAGVQEIEDAFEELIKKLKAAFDEFVKAVNAIGKVTPASADAIETAWNAYFACAAFGNIEDLDGILGNEAGSDVTIANYYNKLSAANAAYDEIMALIKNVKDAIKGIEEFNLLSYTENNVTTSYKDGLAAYTAVYDVLVADLEATLSDIVGWCTELVVDYDQDLYADNVIGETDIAKIERCVFVTAHQYDAIVNVLTVYENYTGRTDTKAENSRNQQVEYIASINWNDEPIKDMNGNVVKPAEEVERCGTVAYITAQFEAAIQ